MPKLSFQVNEKPLIISRVVPVRTAQNTIKHEVGKIHTLGTLFGIGKFTVKEKRC